MYKKVYIGGEGPGPLGVKTAGKFGCQLASLTQHTAWETRGKRSFTLTELGKFRRKIVIPVGGTRGG